MIRGKTDKADARFIIMYGWMRKDALKPMKPVEQNLVALQNLMTYRDKMIVDRASYEAWLKELQGQMGDALHNAVIDSTEEIMKMLSRESKSIEKNIHELIEDNKDLHNSYDLVTNVVGIGFATAVHFIIAPENFTRFENVRKLIFY
jgi:transposase